MIVANNLCVKTVQIYIAVNNVMDASVKTVQIKLIDVPAKTVQMNPWMNIFVKNARVASLVAEMLYVKHKVLLWTMI